MFCPMGGAVVRFDFPVMKARSIKQGFDNDSDWQWKRWLWLDHLEIFRRMNTMVAESGAEKQSFALENIAQAILGEGKDNFDSSKTWEAWKAGGKMVINKLTWYAHKHRSFPRTHGYGGKLADDCFHYSLAKWLEYYHAEILPAWNMA